jgi:MFS family permease
MSPISAPAEARYARNLRLFTWFRILFNARYYYPVFTILYLDYGLTLEQFAILNVVWALTIVIAEVPSGALADILGRKPLLVLAAALMCIEMGLLVWVPLGSALLFPIFLLNRVCSGLAEAAASGADEALAYDSLKALAREGEWSSLLERTAKALSLAFFFTMITGALVYDPTVIHSLQATLGIETLLPESLIVRLPVILTWIHATALLVVVLSFKEPLVSRPQTLRRSIRQQLALPFHQIKEAARWTLGHRFVLFVIIAALAIDSVARQFVVLASEYYRVVEIPTALFGLIGAAISLMGMLTAKLSKHLVHHRSPISNLFFLSVALVIGLSGVSLTLPYWGVLFALPVFAMMGMVQYLSSFYLNREVDSAFRATVLSFRGLALNLGLGVASLLYTGWIALLKGPLSPSADPLPTASVFSRSLTAFPLYYLFLLALILLLGHRLIRRKPLLFSAPGQCHAPAHTGSGNDR